MDAEELARTDGNAKVVHIYDQYTKKRIVVSRAAFDAIVCSGSIRLYERIEELKAKPLDWEDPDVKEEFRWRLRDILELVQHWDTSNAILKIGKTDYP